MVHCPDCGMLIGDSLSKCPGCNKVFTMSDLSIMEKERKENEMQLESKRRKAFDDYLKKRRLFVILLLIELVLLNVSVWTVLAVTKNMTATTAALVINIFLMIVIFIWGIKSGGALCYHCGALLFRNFGEHCAYCGKNLHRYVRY